MFYVARGETGTIAADDDDFIVSELMHFLDGVFQTRREIVAGLPVNSKAGPDGTVAGGKEMDIHSRRKFQAESGQIQEWTGRGRQAASREINMRLIGKNENGLAGHAFGYETVRATDKHIHGKFIRPARAKMARRLFLACSAETSASYCMR